MMPRSIKLAGLIACAALSASAASRAPHITSISPISRARLQDIVILGTGFGNLKPYKGDSDYIEFNVCRGKGCAVSFRYGYTPNGNQTGLIVNRWTSTEIDIGGFIRYYSRGHPGSVQLEAGDRITLNLWEPGTGESKHGSQCEITVNKGASTCAKR